MILNQYHICIVDLNPTRDPEMHKVRPCIVLSPAEANKHLNTVIVWPAILKIHRYRFRVQFHSGKTSGEIAFDQIRSINKSRITKITGRFDTAEISRVKSTIREFLVD